MQHINLTAIQFDSATQIRAEINNEVVNAYAELMQAGTKFPYPVLFYDGDKYWIADGWHRLLAKQRNGDVTVACEVWSGSRTDAIKYALSANATHGLPRTNADKRKAVAIATREFGNLSNVEIARLCAVSDMTVKRVRDSQPQQSGGWKPRLGADGKLRRMPKSKDSGNGATDDTPSLPGMADPNAEAEVWSKKSYIDRVQQLYDYGRQHCPPEDRSYVIATLQARFDRLLTDLPGGAASAFGDPNLIPPLPQWVTAYSASIGYPLDGEEWCELYASCGYVFGKHQTPITNWQATVKVWKRKQMKLGKAESDPQLTDDDLT